MNKMNGEVIPPLSRKEQPRRREWRLSLTIKLILINRLSLGLSELLQYIFYLYNINIIIISNISNVKAIIKVGRIKVSNPSQSL